MASPTKHDVWTVVAIAVVAYTLKNVVHELIGHGGACVMVGGRPIAVSSAWWDGAYDGVSQWGRQWVRMGGTAANLVLAVAMLPAWRAACNRWSTASVYFVWLTIVINLLSAGGYMMVDAIAGFGDWGGVLENLESAGVARIIIVTVGIAVSVVGLLWGRRTIPTFLPNRPEARRSALLRLCWLPYFAGSTVFVISAAFNPEGKIFMATVAAATFGGTAWLAWFLPFIVEPDANAGSDPRGIARSRAWQAAGVGAALFTLAALGPSIRF